MSASAWADKLPVAPYWDRLLAGRPILRAAKGRGLTQLIVVDVAALLEVGEEILDRLEDFDNGIIE